LPEAVVAIEDDRFYLHDGVDYVGAMRAGIANLSDDLSQGASTITMQVARNFYLSRQKTYTRKLYEILLAYRIENALSKDEILEIYLNKIYLGQGAYGFGEAAETYFGKPVDRLTLAECAMLAGLPKAPSANNPWSIRAALASARPTSCCGCWNWAASRAPSTMPHCSNRCG
jgi:membrane carboxypeptidase/penicillin-binding protein